MKSQRRTRVEPFFGEEHAPFEDREHMRFLVDDSVDDPIALVNQLPDRLIAELGEDAASKGLIPQERYPVSELGDEAGGIPWIPSRDVVADLEQVVAGSGGPAYAYHRVL
jgi:hypothetical protein